MHCLGNTITVVSLFRFLDHYYMHTDKRIQFKVQKVQDIIKFIKVRNSLSFTDVHYRMVQKISRGTSVKYTYAKYLQYKLNLLKIVCDTVTYYLYYIYCFLFFNILGLHSSDIHFSEYSVSYRHLILAITVDII